MAAYGTKRLVMISEQNADQTDGSEKSAQVENVGLSDDLKTTSELEQCESSEDEETDYSTLENEDGIDYSTLVNDDNTDDPSKEENLRNPKRKKGAPTVRKFIIQSDDSSEEDDLETEDDKLFINNKPKRTKTDSMRALLLKQSEQDDMQFFRR